MVDPSSKDRYLKVLRTLAQIYGILPKSYFPAGVTLANNIPYTSRGFADVWEGRQGGKLVCIKAFRIPMVTEPEKIKRVCGGSLSR